LALLVALLSARCCSVFFGLDSLWLPASYAGIFALALLAQSKRIMP
jgi:hypothetical protein